MLARSVLAGRYAGHSFLQQTRCVWHRADDRDRSREVLLYEGGADRSRDRDQDLRGPQPVTDLRQDNRDRLGFHGEYDDIGGRRRDFV